jgi:hypothetical protein
MELIKTAMSEKYSFKFQGLRRKGWITIFRMGSTNFLENKGEKYTDTPIRSGRRAYVDRTEYH